MGGFLCCYVAADFDNRLILISTFFRKPYFACSQVMLLGSLVSELLLFLLKDLANGGTFGQRILVLHCNYNRDGAHLSW